MDADLILDQYPNAKQAVAFCELIFDPEDWEHARKLEPHYVLHCIQDTIQDAIDDKMQGRCPDALAQTETPDFKRYLTAKLGLL